MGDYGSRQRFSLSRHSSLDFVSRQSVAKARRRCVVTGQHNERALAHAIDEFCRDRELSIVTEGFL